MQGGCDYWKWIHDSILYINLNHSHISLYQMKNHKSGMH